MNAMNLVLLIFPFIFLVAESRSLYECPDDSNADEMLGSAWVEVPAIEHTSLVRRFRLPPTGLYDDVIACFMAIDTSIDDSGGDVAITDGGLNHRFVELRLNSRLGKPLDYLLQAYTHNKEELNMTQSYTDI